MASQVPPSPLGLNLAFSAFLNVESLPKCSSPDDISIGATTTLYDSSSADQAIDDAEICHTISITRRDMKSIKANMPRRSVPVDARATERRRQKRVRPDSDRSPQPRPKRRHDDDDAPSLLVERGRRDKNQNSELDRSNRRSDGRDARKISGKVRPSREFTRRASVIGDSDDDVEPVLKISTRTRTRSTKRSASEERDNPRTSGISKPKVVLSDSSDDEKYRKTRSSAPKSTGSRQKYRVARDVSLDERKVAREDTVRSSENENSVSDESDHDSERSLDRKKSSKSSRITSAKRASSEFKLSKTAISKKSVAAGPSSSRRTSSHRKKQAKEEPPAQLRALGGTRKDSGKHVRYTEMMQKKRDAMAAEAAVWKAEGGVGADSKNPDAPIAPLQHITDFANSASNASKFNLGRHKSYNKDASRFTLAVIPNCDIFQEVDLMRYLVHTCEEHLKTLSALCKHSEKRLELNGGIDSLQCSLESELAWSKAVTKMFIVDEDPDCEPPLVKSTTEAVQLIFKIIEKVINHGEGDTVEEFYRHWYDARLGNLTGQLAWNAIELWDLLEGDSKVDQKPSKLVDWSLCLASITFSFEMRQLPSFPKEVDERSLHLSLYVAKKPFDLPTAIRKGFKYLSKVGGFTRKGGSSFIDLVHTYFTALHYEEMKSKTTEVAWKKAKCSDFAASLAKEDLFWSAVVSAPLSSALNRGRVHESISEIAFAVALLRYAPTCRAVFMCEAKAREVILSLALRILKEMSRDLLSFFEVIWDRKKDSRNSITADDLVKIILKFGFSQRELMYSSNEWRNEYLDAVREIIMNTKKLAWLPLEHLAPRIFYERGPFPRDSGFSLECDSMPTKTLPNSKEYDLRLYGFACLTWLIGSLGVSMEDGSHEISQANTMNFLLSRTTSARISQQILEMLLTVQLHVEKYIYPGTRKRHKKTEMTANVDRMDLLTKEERNKFVFVLNIVRLRVRELKGLGAHKYDREEEMPVATDKEEEGEMLQSMLSGLKESTYIVNAVSEPFVCLDDDPSVVKSFAETLREDGQQLLARFDPTSELSTRWVRLNRRNAYVGDARSQLSHGERAVGLSCTCVPGQTRSAAGDILQLGCSNDMCENRQVKIECGPGPCGAGDTCKNRRLQNMDYVKTKHKKVEEKGVGLFADENIRPGSLIGEYQGEVLSQDEFRRRKIEYRGERHFYFMTLTRNLVIDASRKSQITRFVNHSCEPNCVTEKWNAGGEPRVAIVALRDIPKGEEITFDYGAHSVGLDSAPCLCGSMKCRGKLAAAKKTSQQKEEDVAMEGVEEKTVASMDMNVEPEPITEDLEKYVKEKIAEGKQKIERAEEILQNVANMRGPLAETVDENRFDDKARAARAQRLADWNVNLDRFEKRDVEMRDNDEKIDDKGHTKPLSEVKPPDAYRIPRLPPKSAEKKSDVNEISVPRQKRTDTLAAVHGKEKQKPSRFSGSEEFFADYDAKIRALQVPELDTEGRPVNVNTHYMRGMNPEMTFQALELTVRSEARVGSHANRHPRQLEHKQPKNSPFMPTKRTVKPKLEGSMGPRRPIFAPRKRTGKYRNDDDSMDGYSTASSAEPIENYKLPEISDSGDEGLSAGFEDEFTPAPPLESLSYEQREREKFSRYGSQAPHQRDSEHVNHPMAPRRVGERVPRGSRPPEQSGSIDSGRHNDHEERQQMRRNWSHDSQEPGYRQDSGHEIQSRRSRFDSTHQYEAEVKARRRAEDWQRQIYPHGVLSQSLDVPDHERNPQLQHPHSNVGPSALHGRQGTGNLEKSGWRQGTERSGQHRERFGDMEDKIQRTQGAVIGPEMRQHSTKEYSKGPDQPATRDPNLTGGLSHVLAARHGRPADETSRNDSEKSPPRQFSEFGEAGKAGVSLVPSEPLRAQGPQLRAVTVQKPTVVPSQGTVRRSRSFLGLRSKPMPLRAELDKVDIQVSTQAKSSVSGKSESAPSEKPTDADLSAIAPETKSVAVEPHISPKNSKSTSHPITAPEKTLAANKRTNLVGVEAAIVVRAETSKIVVEGKVQVDLSEATTTPNVQQPNAPRADSKKVEVNESQPPPAGSKVATTEGKSNDGCGNESGDVPEGKSLDSHRNESGGVPVEQQVSQSKRSEEKAGKGDNAETEQDLESEKGPVCDTVKSTDHGERESDLDCEKTRDKVSESPSNQKRGRSQERRPDRSPKRQRSKSPEQSQAQYKRESLYNTNPELRHGGDDRPYRRPRLGYGQNFGDRRNEHTRGNYRHNHRDRRADYGLSQDWDRRHSFGPSGPSGWSQGHGQVSRERHGGLRFPSLVSPRRPRREPLTQATERFRRSDHNEGIEGSRMQGMARQGAIGAGHTQNTRDPLHGSRNERFGGRKGQERPRDLQNRRLSAGGSTGSGLRSREQERTQRGGHTMFTGSGGSPGRRPHHTGFAPGDGGLRDEHPGARSRFSNPQGSGGSPHGFHNERSEAERVSSFGGRSSPSEQISIRQRSGNKPNDLREILKNSKGNKQ